MLKNGRLEAGRFSFIIYWLKTGSRPGKLLGSPVSPHFVVLLRRSTHWGVAGLTRRHLYLTSQNAMLKRSEGRSRHSYPLQISRYMPASRIWRATKTGFLKL